jgi:phosphoribosylformylglycinamidine synthase
MPIAHGEGGFAGDPAEIETLETAGRVVFRYCDPRGRVTPEANPNGSAAFIGGVANAAGNVVGLMPHPERASETLMGSADGRRVFESAIAYLERRAAAGRVPAGYSGAASVAETRGAQ